MALASEKKALTALVHPIATMIISNHFTRTALLNGGKYAHVVGALLGKQNSRTIEIQNCFEVELNQEGRKWVLNAPHFENREKMYQETFPDQSFLGFYVVGDHQNVNEFDRYLYEQATSSSDFAVVLKMSPLIDPLNDKIPLNIFEAVYDSQNGQQVFSPVTVKIVSGSAEQIAIDHAAKFTSADDQNETTSSKKLGEQASALKMLSKGLTLASDYMKAVEEGKLPADQEILRELHKLAIKLSFLQRNEIKPALGYFTINDTLTVLLTMTTKLLGSIFSIINKLNMIISEHNNPGPSTPMKRKENFM